MEQYNELKEILEQYGKDILESMSFYSMEEIPEKKLNNAIGAYAESVEKTKVYALVDTTLFGSAKEGMIFTNAGIYMKESFGKPKYIAYADIVETKVTKLDKEKDCDRVLEVTLQNEEIIRIESIFFKKTSLKTLIDKIVELRDNGKVGKMDKYVALEYMNDTVKENYLKTIIAFMNIDERIDEKEISELYALMTQIKVSVELRKSLITYLGTNKDELDDVLSKMDENIPEASEQVLHFSLIKDLFRVGKSTQEVLGEAQNVFIKGIADKYDINDSQIEFLSDAIDIDKKILSGEVKDAEIVDSMKDLASKAGAVGVPIVAVYLSGSVLGLGAAGITSGLAALGLGGVLGLSSMVTGIGVAVLIGVSAYKGLRWITGGSERDKVKQREFLIQEAIKNNQETINNLIEDINSLTMTVVDLLKDIEINKMKIDKLTKEITVFNQVFSTLRNKGINFEKVLYDEK